MKRGGIQNGTPPTHNPHFVFSPEVPTFLMVHFILHKPLCHMQMIFTHKIIRL